MFHAPRTHASYEGILILDRSQTHNHNERYESLQRIINRFRHYIFPLEISLQGGSLSCVAGTQSIRSESTNMKRCFPRVGFQRYLQRSKNSWSFHLEDATTGWDLKQRFSFGFHWSLVVFSWMGTEIVERRTASFNLESCSPFMRLPRWQIATFEAIDFARKYTTYSECGKSDYQSKFGSKRADKFFLPHSSQRVAGSVHSIVMIQRGLLYSHHNDEHSRVRRFFPHVALKLMGGLDDHFSEWETECKATQF